jgi:hypothetical protein
MTSLHSNLRAIGMSPDLALAVRWVLKPWPGNPWGESTLQAPKLWQQARREAQEWLDEHVWEDFRGYCMEGQTVLVVPGDDTIMTLDHKLSEYANAIPTWGRAPRP